MAATDSRPLSGGERTLAASMFGEAIDYDPVRIHRRKYWPLHPKQAIMAPDGDIWVHPKGSLWSDDYSRASLGLQALFVHEMTHVWQAQRSGKYYLPLMRHPFCRYAYNIRLGWPFARYGLEQQAEIMRHAFLLRNGRSFPGAPPLAQLESIVPFGRL